MKGKSNKETLEGLSAIVEGLIPIDRVKKEIASDSEFKTEIIEAVMERMVNEGYVEDRLLSAKEVMKLLDVVSRNTLYNLSEKGLNPIRIKPNSHPKYRMSDVMRFIRTRRSVRYHTAS